MVGSRRTEGNFALQHAAARAAELGVPLLVFEPLRVDYPWACDRFHQFVIDGMRDNARALARAGITYYPYVEPEPGAGRGLLQVLARAACAVVTDDSGSHFLRPMTEAAGARMTVAAESVNGDGLYPVRATTRVFTTAASFRRHLQKELPAHLSQMPQMTPLQAGPARARIPGEALARWGYTNLDHIDVADLPIDHSVAPTRTGGPAAALSLLADFIDERLGRYDERNQPESEAQSSLSPYLHFGHIGAHQIFWSMVEAEGWSPSRVADKPTGSRAGWWGMSANAEAFLDQLITWRELGANMAAHHPAPRSFESLPSWAQTTLARHESDERPHLYTLEQLESAQTHDELWNAAQTQLVREGTIHNYMRMLWGKKILEWSPTPRVALDAMIELNNKYALDGRDPNSYSGIFWVLGRYDRAWGPERPIFGKVRYMSSDSARRKLRVKSYIARYSITSAGSCTPTR